jgi:hypothetical protein
VGLRSEEFIFDLQLACAMMTGMRLLHRRGIPVWLRNGLERPGAVEVASEMKEILGEEAGAEESSLLKTVGWVSAALGAVALGLIVGSELRARYKFNRRTPYDMYAHSGDELAEADCGVGI